jgi:hypothetical protein
LLAILGIANAMLSVIPRRLGFLTLAHLEAADDELVEAHGEVNLENKVYAGWH